MYQQFFVFNIGEETLFGVPLYALKQDFIQPSALVIFSFFSNLHSSISTIMQNHRSHYFYLFLKYNHKSLGRSPFSNSKFMTQSPGCIGIHRNRLYAELPLLSNCDSQIPIFWRNKKSIAFFFGHLQTYLFLLKEESFQTPKRPFLKKNYVYISFRLNSIFILTNHAELDSVEVILLDI